MKIPIPQDIEPAQTTIDKTNRSIILRVVTTQNYEAIYIVGTVVYRSDY